MKALSRSFILLIGLSSLLAFASEDLKNLLVERYMAFKLASIEAPGRLDPDEYFSRHLARDIQEKIAPEYRLRYYELAAPLHHVNGGMLKRLSDKGVCLLMTGLDSAGQYAAGSVRFVREQGKWKIDEMGSYLPTNASDSNDIPRKPYCPKELADWSQKVSEAWLEQQSGPENTKAGAPAATP